MIDLETNKDQLFDILKNIDLNFRVYDSDRTLRVILISEYLPLCQKSLDLMSLLGANPIYFEYVRMRGYFLRVSGEKSDFISANPINVGNGIVNENISNFLKLMDLLCQDPSISKIPEYLSLSKFSTQDGIYPEYYEYPGILWTLREEFSSETYEKLSFYSPSFIEELFKNDVFKGEPPITKKDGELEFKIYKTMTTMTLPNIMMLDWDEVMGIKKEIALKILDLFCLKYPDFRFRVFETDRGIHAYCISRYFTPQESIKYYTELLADEAYIVFALKHGFSSRITKKYPSDFIAKHWGYKGSGQSLVDIEKFIDNILFHIKKCLG